MALLFHKITKSDRSRGRTTIIYGGRANIDSAIAPLLRGAAGACTSRLPERRSELLELQKRITVEVDATVEIFYIAAHVPDKRVILGLAALERIWAFTYFYLAVLELKSKNKVIDLTKIPGMQPARELAQWALKCEKSRKRLGWPEGLPRPDKAAADDKRISDTNKFFYGALSFMILHEIGHIELQHTLSRFENRDTSYKMEFEADKWAAKFMLDKWRSGGRETDFTARCTSIAFGLSLLTGVELYHTGAPDDHPTIAERLLKFFNAFSLESTGKKSAHRNFPMHISSTVIHVNLLNAGILFDFHKEYEDINDYLIAAHQAMNKHKRR